MPLNFPALDNSTLSPKENNAFKSRLMAITLCFFGFKLSNLKPLEYLTQNRSAYVKEKINKKNLF